jgi:hypothetical protein
MITSSLLKMDAFYDDTVNYVEVKPADELALS